MELIESEASRCQIAVHVIGMDSVQAGWQALAVRLGGLELRVAGPDCFGDSLQDLALAIVHRWRLELHTADHAAISEGALSITSGHVHAHAVVRFQ
jgi:hypothetical protein